MSDGSMTLSPLASNCCGTYLNPLVRVPALVSGFVTVTLT